MTAKNLPAQLEKYRALDANGLKCCPFCGGKAYLVGGAITWNVECDGCTASVGGIAGYNLPKTAIEDWNNRQHEADLEASIALNRELVKAIADFRKQVLEQHGPTPRVSFGLIDHAETLAAQHGITSESEKG